MQITKGYLPIFPKTKNKGISKSLCIKFNFDKDFTKQIIRLSKKHPDELAQLNGLSESQLDYTDFITNFIDESTVADASIDGNSNVSNKDILTLLHEMPKPHQKLLALHKIYYEIKKQYGKDQANIWLAKEYDGHLYMHDANTSSFFSYCFAYDLKYLAEKGLFFIENFNSCPPKHLVTFVDFVKEFISYTSNRTSGACGLPNLIPYMYYFWDRDVKNNYFNETPEKYAKQNIQRFIYAVNQPYVRDAIQSAFTNTSVFDHEYLAALFGGAQFPDGAFMIDEIEGIMQFQKWYLEVTSETRAKNMFTFPVNSISLLYKDGKFIDEEFAKYAINHNMKWADSNIFNDSSVTSLSNCCRLKNDIRDLGYFNSIGSSALKVGSVKVNTVNLARIAYESASEDEYINNLRENVEIALIALDRVRHIIKRNVEKGLLKNFSQGLIDFEHCYSTVGFVGIYETMKTFGYTHEDDFGNTYYNPEAESLGKKIFDTIHMISAQFSKDKNYKINCEQIPGETAAAKLMQKDLIFHPEETITDLPLYGNQFIPLGIKTTLHERVRIASTFDKFCNGGSILHVNIEAPFTNFDQAWKMANYIASQGVTYYAFTTKIQACKHNHAFFGNKCPDCGEPVATEYARIVGYYVPIKSYSKKRKAEYYLREWEPINDQHED